MFTVQTQQINAAPLASINGPYQVRTFCPLGSLAIHLKRVCCAGAQGTVNKAIKFDSTGSRDPDSRMVEYLWIFGDNTVGQTTAFPEHTYAKAGEYNVSLVVYDNIQVPFMTVGHSTFYLRLTILCATGRARKWSLPRR